MANLFSIEGLIATGFGAILYFLFAFRKMKLFTPNEKFQILYWFRDNYVNIILTLACFAAVNYLKGHEMNRFEAFALGFGWNKVIDYFQDFIGKKPTT